MAPIGTINSSIELDKDSFQGSDDLVTGTVTLTFNANVPSKKQEIFGPLNLAVVLRCHIKLIVRENRTSHAYILFHERRQISGISVQLFNGPFRAVTGQPQKFPFQICFPQSTDYFQGRRAPLPPTFHARLDVTAPRQFGKHQGQAWIGHSLCVKTNMLGIDVQMPNTTDFTTIQYEQSSLLPPYGSVTREFDQKLEVQTYELLPEQERPSSLLDKTKAIIKSLPKPVYAFDAICANIPEAVAVGQAIDFEVRIRAESQAGTATSIPEVTFASGKVELIATTKLYATNEKGVDSPKLENTSNIVALTVREQGPGGPFSKSNDFTKSISTEPLPADIPSSFSIAKLERSYRMRIELRLLVAGQSAVIKKEMDLRLLPRNTTFAAEAGPSVPGRAVVEKHDELPAYEVAINTPSGVASVER